MAQFEYPAERPVGANRRNMKFIKAHHAHRRRDGLRSSAMSDTSEAPSLASHVRRVRVPSQASDVDQFLDDLFMPVLDGNIDDGLSDARSLAASMRGGGDNKDKTAQAQTVLDLNRMGSFRRRSILLQGSDSEPEEETVDSLMARLRGGGSPVAGDGSQASPKKQSDFVPLNNSAMGFQPIPGVISPHPVPGMVSPPPMMMPTPMMPGQFSMGGGVNGGMTSPLLMPAGDQQAAMAFTYVPVPVYNLGGMGMQGMMPGMMPGVMPGGMSSMNYSSLGTANLPTSGPASPTKTGETSQPAATSTPMSPQPSNLGAPESQMAYQHAFLQNAVAQNMQIQQQLMLQNQALSQLLQQTSLTNNQTSMSPEHDQEAGKPSKPTPVYFGMDEAQRRASETHLNMSQGHSQVDLKPRSKTAPNTPKHSNAMPPQAPQLPSGGPMDAYSRARTVRIGKWRWPPPKEDGDALAEGFFQFKMRKMKEREGFDDPTDGARNESLETSG